MKSALFRLVRSHTNVFLLRAAGAGACAWLLILTGCPSSHESSGLRRSKWLQSCSSNASCGEDSQCVCGTCTVACEARKECQSPGAPAAACVDPRRLGISDGCVSRLGGEARMCMRSCTDGVGCERGERCLKNVCVAKDLLASNESEPETPSDAGQDAVAPDADPPSDAGQDVGVGDIQDAGADTTMDAEVEPEPVWTGPGCEPAPADRPRCGEDQSCEAGLLCHIDGTCIEPGRCDALGVTTLARTTAEPFALSERYLYLQIPGRYTGTTREAGLARIPLDGGGLQWLARDLQWVQQVKLAGDSIFFETDVGVMEVVVDASAAPATRDPGTLPPRHVAADLKYLYVGTWSHLVRIDRGSGEELELSLDGPLEEIDYDVQMLETDGDILVVVHPWTDWVESNPVTVLSIDGEHLAETNISYPTAIALTRDSIIVAGSEYWDYFPNVARYDRHGRFESELASFPEMENVGIRGLRVHRGRAYFAVSDGIYRTLLKPAKEEQPVRVAAVSGSEFCAVGDRGLFYTARGRVLRKVLPEMYDEAAPQGAPGAPCFDDGLCSGDAVCRQFSCTLVYASVEECTAACEKDSACTGIDDSGGSDPEDCFLRYGDPPANPESAPPPGALPARDPEATDCGLEPLDDWQRCTGKRTEYGVYATRSACAEACLADPQCTSLVDSTWHGGDTCTLESGWCTPGLENWYEEDKGRAYVVRCGADRTPATVDTLDDLPGIPSPTGSGCRYHLLEGGCEASPPGSPSMVFDSAWECMAACDQDVACTGIEDPWGFPDPPGCWLLYGDCTGDADTAHQSQYRRECGLEAE